MGSRGGRHRDGRHPLKPGRLLPFFEALPVFLLASAGIRLQPFAVVAQWATRRCAGAEADEADIALVRRATLAWAKRAPWRSLCLEQGVTAARLLTRRGLAATLYYGAAMIDGELKAHVWVRSGDRDVIGCENATDFAILSQFSNDSSSSPVHS